MSRRSLRVEIWVFPFASWNGANFRSEILSIIDFSQIESRSFKTAFTLSCLLSGGPGVRPHGFMALAPPPPPPRRGGRCTRDTSGGHESSGGKTAHVHARAFPGRFGTPGIPMSTSYLEHV